MSEQKLYFYGNIPIEYPLTEEKKIEFLQNYPPPELPDEQSSFDLQQQTKGDPVNIQVLLNDFQVRLTRQQKEFLTMNFSHSSGTISAVMWDNNGEVEHYQPMLEKHSIFQLEGRVHEFNHRKSITVTKLTPYTDEIQPFSLLPYTKEDITELTLEFFSYLNELTEPYRTIAFKTMDYYWKDFSMSPAARGFHHNYLGGLLKHTVGLMRFARYVLKFEENHYQAVIKLISIVEKAYKQELWNRVIEEDASRAIWQDTIDHLYTMLHGMIDYKNDSPNYDIVMISILFHDLGKLLEYNYVGRSSKAFETLFPTSTIDFSNRKETGITMDELGVMIGHIPYGFLLFSNILERENISLPIEEIHTVSHCILSHHGLPEWGSCVKEPQCAEGYIVHIADFLDSRYENVVEIK